MDFSRLTDPQAYKQALAGLLRRGGEVTDFIATAPEKAGQAILDGHEKNKALQSQAFANPNRPFQVTNQQAMGELGDRMLAGPLSVAPVGMIAYHGTPHTILDKFDINKVGTGEGAQAYGHGMYFAEAPAVAETYKKAGSELKLDFNKPLQELNISPFITTHNLDFDSPLNSALSRIAKRIRTDALDNPNLPVDKNLVKEQFDNYINMLDDKYVADAAQKKALQELIKKEGYPSPSFGGNLYKVDIPDEYLPKMLDWDKPLKDQPKNVQDAFSNFDSIAAKDLERGTTYMQRWFRSPSTAKQLNELGYKGFKYLDGTSRGQGTGTSNYVVFDPTDVKILERNNQPISQNSFESVVEPIKQRGLIMDAYESNKSPKITISRIEVPKEMRGTGMGSQALKELSQYADQSKKTIVLSPSKDFGATSVNRLKDFYKRFGFVENKGRNKDLSISESMYRLPTAPTRKELIQQQIDKIE